MKMLQLLAVFLSVFGIASFSSSSAQNLQSFEEKVTEFTLENGLHFIVIERGVAPIASFVTFVDVGSANEPSGNTGIAHVFEHMVFKGTRTIGTTDWELEQAAIDRMDAAYDQWVEEKYQPDPDEAKMQALWEEFERWQEEAEQYVINEEFTRIIEGEGAVGLNAFTSADGTGYFYSLPQNKAELWFFLEAERFKSPVFREFYVEKDVIMEERRMRTDSSPQGRLIEEFVSVAYSAHPYRNPVIGWPSDIVATTIEDTRRFYETYYTPSSFTIAIAGDVDADRMRQLAEKYFGDLPAGEAAPAVKTIEPEQRGERRFVINEPSQPLFIAGYKSVEVGHPDYAALELLGSILSSGRTSRLYRRMVEEEQLALAVQALSGFPGEKFPSLFVTFAVPNRGVALEDIERVLDEEIAGAQAGDITQAELDRAVTNARAELVRSLNSNMGLALKLAQTHAQQGDWRQVFRRLDELQEVTLEKLQQVAAEYLVPKNRTVGMLSNLPAKGESL